MVLPGPGVAGVVGACIVVFWVRAASGPSDDLDSSETMQGTVCALSGSLGHPRISQESPKIPEKG